MHRLTALRRLSRPWPALAALTTTELFVHLGSFALELLAFAALWWALDAAVSRAVPFVGALGRTGGRER